MISKNAQIFKSFSQENGISLKFISEDEDFILYSMLVKVQCGCKFKMDWVFSKDDSMVLVRGNDIISGINPSKINYMYKVVNDLNKEHTAFKFVLKNESTIDIYAFMLFENNFNARVIGEMAYRLTLSVEEAYPKLMRIVLS